MHAWQFAKAQRVAMLNYWTPFTCMQNLYNLVYREEEREIIPMCVDLGVGIIPWSPLAGGFLTGREQTARSKAGPRHDWWTDRASKEILEVVKAIANEKKVTPAQIGVAWLLAKDAVTAPIIGVTKMSHVEDGIRALNIKLTAEEITRLETPYQPRKVVGWHA